MRVSVALVLVLAGCAAPSSLAPQTLRGAMAATTGTHFLYISDLYSSVVDIYSVPSLKFVKSLTGFFEPQGECTNAAGDVWIANTGDQQMVEYAPGETKPMATLTDTLGYPASCAVNPINGDLAVTDQHSLSGISQVLIYPDASGTPQAFRNGKTVSYGFAAYDDSGNLYVDGESVNSKYVLSQLPAHGNRLSTVRIAGATIRQAGTILWNDGHLILGDQACRGGTSSCLYVATVRRDMAKVSATIALGDSCDVVQVTIFGGALYGGNDNDQCSSKSSSVDRWSYPKGQREGMDADIHEPIGAAISGPATAKF